MLSYNRLGTFDGWDLNGRKCIKKIIVLSIQCSLSVFSLFGGLVDRVNDRLQDVDERLVELRHLDDFTQESGEFWVLDLIGLSLGHYALEADVEGVFFT